MEQFDYVSIVAQRSGGIGGYDLADDRDRVFSFDHNSSGKLDHLVPYRPGLGTLWILRNNGGAFSPVYAEGSPGVGIDDYDLGSRADQAFAFDYNGSGKADHLVLYRPGTGRISVLKQGPAIPPTIADFSPKDGVQGDTVVIRGNSLRRTRRVQFNNAIANIINKQNTWVSATVPANVHSGPITVQTPVGYATSGTPFLVLPPPFIKGFTPTSGKVGAGVTITGGNFRRVTAVRFNGVPANFHVMSDTTITTSVPGNATNGPITVVCAGGTATSSSTFLVIVTPPPANLAFITTWMEPTERPGPGQPFTVYFSFYNGGGTATGTFTIRLQLDNGTAYSDIAAPSYAPGAGDVVFWTFPSGLPAGSHWFYAYLDVFNNVAEISEKDNISYHGFGVS